MQFPKKKKWSDVLPEFNVLLFVNEIHVMKLQRKGTRQEDHEECLIYNVTCCRIDTGFGLIIGFTEHLLTCKCKG
jgi:hypothetical protein